MISVHLPRDLAAELEIAEHSSLPAAATLGALLAQMDAENPGLRRRLMEADGSIRQHINVFIGDRLARGAKGPSLPLSDGDDVWVIRAISGG